MNASTFNPGYVWPAPAFPFREYYAGPKCRVFIIENIQHNWQWMHDWAHRFRETDHFLVYCGWYHSPHFAKQADAMLTALGLKKEMFFFMFNSPLEQANFQAAGFHGEVINHNAWLDENLVMRPKALPKAYRAIYVGRRSAFKRHHLAAQVSGLALIAGNNHGNNNADLPPHDFINTSALTPAEVCDKINQSSCGLILSASEGACFASSEYLLCGIPVVSTASTGGRDIWYDDYNSIICHDTADSVAAAVDEFNRFPRDPEAIRGGHLRLAKKMRKRFIDHLQVIFTSHCVDVDAVAYFRENFFHKMRRSYKPDFQKIFG